METAEKKCFVCERTIKEVKHKNKVTNLPVCCKCKGTDAEKKMEKDIFYSLAEGFVCGCI